VAALGVDADRLEGEFREKSVAKATKSISERSRNMILISHAV
jgi:hypothetical protein